MAFLCISSVWFLCLGYKFFCNFAIHPYSPFMCTLYHLIPNARRRRSRDMVGAPQPWLLLFERARVGYWIRYINTSQSHWSRKRNCRILDHKLYKKLFFGNEKYGLQEHLFMSMRVWGRIELVPTILLMMFEWRASDWLGRTLNPHLDKFGMYRLLYSQNCLEKGNPFHFNWHLMVVHQLALQKV